MKRMFTTIAAVVATVCLLGQAPQKMSYQAVIRDATNHLVATQIGMKISILQGAIDGISVYSEIQTPTPNINGLVTIEIGGGDPVTFAAINWSAGPYFIKTETAVVPPLTAYTITGTSQLLSVPYALHAKTVANYPEADPVFVAWNKSLGISINASQVTDFQTSVTNNDAVLANTAKNSYPTADATKLEGIATGAEVNVNADWNANEGDAQILNKPSIPIGLNKGDMQYWDGSAWVIVIAGTYGQLLGVNSSGIPEWQAPAFLKTATTNTPFFSHTTVKLKGVVNTNGISTTVTFEYGPTKAYGTTVTASESPVISTSDINVSATITPGLTVGETYHYRVVTENIYGTFYTNDMTFFYMYNGANFGGGIVYNYNYETPHGLICAPSDQSHHAIWCLDTCTIGAGGKDIGTGNQNTIDIITSCSTAGIAAKICDDLVLNGYDDWYLPSQYELDLLGYFCIELGFGTYGFFTEHGEYYWSSTNSTQMYAFAQYLWSPSDSHFTELLKSDNGVNVRAIRAF